MIKTWYAIHRQTGEIMEAVEPIPFKRFLIESRILTDYARNYIIGYNKGVLTSLQNG